MKVQIWQMFAIEKCDLKIDGNFERVDQGLFSLQNFCWVCQGSYIGLRSDGGKTQAQQDHRTEKYIPNGDVGIQFQ